jgi:hypothetical protein
VLSGYQIDLVDTLFQKLLFELFGAQGANPFPFGIEAGFGYNWLFYWS